MIKFEVLQDLAQSLTKIGCAVLIVKTDIRLIEVTSFGTAKYMSALAAYWYLHGLIEVYSNMPQKAQEMCRVRKQPVILPRQYPEDIPTGNDPSDTIPSGYALNLYKKSISDDLQ